MAIPASRPGRTRNARDAGPGANSRSGSSSSRGSSSSSSGSPSEACWSRRSSSPRCCLPGSPRSAGAEPPLRPRPVERQRRGATFRPMSSTDDTSEIDVLLADIPQSANTLGEPSAPATLEYFGDLECPFCQQFSLEVLPSIIRRWVHTGKLQIKYRALQTATREPDVFLAQQVAALAAGKQDKAWYFV